MAFLELTRVQTIVYYVFSKTVKLKGDVMRNLLILGSMFMGLTLVGCGDDADDTAIEDTEVEDTSAEEEDGNEAGSEETE